MAELVPGGSRLEAKVLVDIMTYYVEPLIIHVCDVVVS